MLMKKCPKCRGDIYVERYLGGIEDWVCLQCGYTLSPQLEVVLAVPFGKTRVAGVPQPSTKVAGRRRLTRA